MKRKKWLITGISSGLGEALAEEVMMSGDYVIGTFRKEEEVSAFNEKYQGKREAHLLDITQFDAVKRLIDENKDIWKEIDVLVNNAGIGFIGAIEETSLEETRRVFEANFFGALHLTQCVLPIMRAQKTGHIIQISSHGGIKAFAGFGIYNASKFALEGFSEALAQEVEPLGIRVSIIEPGPFRTNFAGKWLGEASALISDYDETAGLFRKKLKGVHQKQEGDPAKAAKAIVEWDQHSNGSMRLPLGKIALRTIGMKLKSVEADLERNRAVSEKAVYED